MSCNSKETQESYELSLNDVYTKQEVSSTGKTHKKKTQKGQIPTYIIYWEDPRTLGKNSTAADLN